MKKTLRHWFALFALAGFVFAAVATSESKDGDESSKVKPSVKTTAVALYTAYDENGVAADEKYKDKWISVTGTVEGIDKDLMDDIYVSLKGDDFIGVVQCMFGDEHVEQTASLKKGQTVTIVGKCSGKVISNVILKKSRLVE